MAQVGQDGASPNAVGNLTPVPQIIPIWLVNTIEEAAACSLISRPSSRRGLQGLGDVVFQ
ncbi:hypothetical protein HMPREF1316_1656 [Olsenella profusa F0195]|uniref:Uncharacterized protein n=1 Tax=Olsenella profusa F0195 TaxID=1125712 RepID=U2V275_9ACTN|nr:hypothetical protein HMPREF1316_1656 [Olsenella profusa F0195]